MVHRRTCPKGYSAVYCGVVHFSMINSARSKSLSKVATRVISSLFIKANETQSVKDRSLQFSKNHSQALASSTTVTLIIVATKVLFDKSCLNLSTISLPQRFLIKVKLSSST